MDPELLNKAIAASSHIEPAELHGMVCGLAASNPGTFSMPEFVDLVGTDGLTDEETAQDFVAATLDQLHAQDMEFHLLIPDDDEPLGERVLATGTWCAAFLSGFGAGVAYREIELKMLPDDVQELLRDFASLSGMDDDVEDTDQDETSFMEIYEYVRVAAILAHTLMNSNEGDDAGPGSPAGETLH